jgi:polyhydroxyalkanoate synthesis regulator phasin
VPCPDFGQGDSVRVRLDRIAEAFTFQVAIGLAATSFKSLIGSSPLNVLSGNEVRKPWKARKGKTWKFLESAFFNYLLKETKMIYSALTTEELKRAAYIDPSNTEAKDELLKRAKAAEHTDEEFDDLEGEHGDAINSLEEEKGVNETLRTEVDEANAYIASLDQQVEALKEKIESPTRAEDLV